MSLRHFLRKGVFFSLDAVFGTLALFTLISILTLVSVETVSSENIHQILSYQAEDAVSVLAKTKLREVKHLSVVTEMEEAGMLVQVDDDFSLMEVVAALWAADGPGCPECKLKASLLIQQALEPSMPKNADWRVTIDGEVVHQTKQMTNARFMSAVSNRMVSGYMKGQPHLGYTARAFLSNIQGKSESAYVFFGGFTGQGDISGYLRGIPADAEITGLYIEARAGSNFNLFIHNDSIGPTPCSINPITIDEVIDPVTGEGYLSEDLSACKDLLNNGTTKIYIEFTENNITKQYLGGGYLRANYSTSIMAPMQPTTKRYYFPGIHGIVNVFDSFFVPGEVIQVTGVVNLTTNYGYYITLGNATIFNSTDLPVNISYAFDAGDILTNLTLHGLQAENISNTTFPIRVGTPEATFVFGGEESDVVLVTDVSGSMSWCEDQTDACCGSCDPGPCFCGLPNELCGYESTFFEDAGTTVCAMKPYSEDCLPENRKKIETVVDALNNFTSAVLDGTDGSRIGIVDYSSSQNGTVLLPDLEITDFEATIAFVEFFDFDLKNNTYDLTIKNSGFAPVNDNFTLAIFFPTFLNTIAAYGITPINISIDPTVTPLNPGESMNISFTVEQDITYMPPGVSPIAWVDCGGNFQHPDLNKSAGGTGDVNIDYPGLCPATVDEYGQVVEYRPGYGGLFFDGASTPLELTNNFKKATVLMPDLAPGYNFIYSIPYYHTQTGSEKNKPYGDQVICRSGSRDPYNQTLVIAFNFTTVGTADVWESFNVTLQRENRKCNYWENVSFSGTSWCIAGFVWPFVQPGPVTCSPIRGNPVEIRPYSGRPAVYAGQPTLIYWYLDIENYTPPTHPTTGADCNDLEDPLYYDGANFSFRIVVDPEGNIDEGPPYGELDNIGGISESAVSGPVYTEQLDLEISYISTNPNSEYCGVPTRYALCSPRNSLPPAEIQETMFNRIDHLSVHVSTYDSDCPLVEEAEVHVWERHEWCPAGYGASPRWNNDCEWQHFAEGRIDYVPERNYSSVRNTTYGSTNIIGYYPDLSHFSYDPPVIHAYQLYTHQRYSCQASPFGSQCCRDYGVYGLVNLSAKVDTTYTGDNLTAILTYPDDWYSQIDEADESDNWELDKDLTHTNESNIFINLMNLYMYDNPGLIDRTRYGSSTIYTACVHNASRGANWPLDINHRPRLYTDNDLCPAMGDIRSALYYGCVQCNQTPSCSNQVNGDNITTDLGHNSVTIELGTHTMYFDGVFQYCAVTDMDDAIYEGGPGDYNENNYASLTIVRKPSDIVPTSTGHSWNITAGADGVTVQNGAAFTCYGAGTTNGPEGPYRYRITGPVTNLGPCSFFEDFTIGLGIVSNDRTIITQPCHLIGSTSCWHNGMVFYNERLKNITTQLPTGSVNPSDNDTKTIYWDGKAPNGVEDYAEYFDRMQVPLYIMLNEPNPPGSQHQPSEPDYLNNRYEDGGFFIYYEAPDLDIWQVNKSREDATSTYTINVSVQNYQFTPANCNTSLQNPTLQIGLYEEAGDVLIENRTITNMDANDILVFTFTYVVSDPKWLYIKIDSDDEIFERNEDNNKQVFEVTKTGAVAPPEIHHNPTVLLSEPEAEKSTSLSLSSTESSSINFAGEIPSSKCTVTAVPDSGFGPFSSTVTITTTELVRSCSIDCRDEGLGNLVMPGGSIVCDYPAVGSVTLYTVRGQCGTATCTDRVTVNPPAVPSCTGMTAVPNSGNPLDGVTVTANYQNLADGTFVDIQCNSTSTVVPAPLVGGSAAIICNYGTIEGLHFPQSNYSTSTCNTTVSVTPIIPLACTGLTAVPNIGNPLNNVGVVATYTNADGMFVDMKCNTTGAPVQSVQVVGGTASIICNYGTVPATHDPYSNYSTSTCTQNVVVAQPACTGIIANPAAGNPLNGVTVEATYQYLADGTNVDIRCNATTAPQSVALSGGKASITCDYGIINSTHNPSSSHPMASSCLTTAVVTDAGAPACLSFTSDDNNKNPLVTQIRAVYANVPLGELVDMQCNATSPAVQVPMGAGGNVNLTCNYGIINSTHYPQSVFNSTAMCPSFPVVVTELGAPACAITANPSAEEAPFTSTLTVGYLNIDDIDVDVCCKPGDCETRHIVGGAASRTCVYSMVGNYQIASNYSSINCTNTVVAALNPFENYTCPNVMDPHIQADFTAYGKYPIYTDSIIQRTELLNNSPENRAIIDGHIANTETLHGTCICCGILESIDVFKDDWASTPENSYRPASMVVMSDGQPTDGCADRQAEFQYLVDAGYPALTGDPYNDTITAACYAFEENVTVYTIAFGEQASQPLLNSTAHACNICGCDGDGEFYYAANGDVLAAKYMEVAANILNVSYTSQSIAVEGAGFSNSTLNETSYLDFTYIPYVPEFGWNDITLTMESAPFSGCSGTVTVPDMLTPYNAIATSYSGNFWTRSLKIENASANSERVYTIDNYCSVFGGCEDYKMLGDPFNIEFNSKTLGHGANDFTYVMTYGPGSTPASDMECGSHNKLIYKAKFAASVPFSEVLPYAEGMPVRLYYDTNGDSAQDGYITVEMAKDIMGIPYDESLPQGWRDVDYLNTEAAHNSIAYSFSQLLAQLNYIDSGVGFAGSDTNPIDILIDPQKVVFRSSSIYEVPYMFGPVDMSVSVWIE